MPEFAWKDEYSIGNETIDAEHRQLIALANTVVTFARSGEKIERIKAAVVSLYDYAKIHFLHEEEFMRQSGYPKLAEHQGLHQAIIHEMNTIMQHSSNIDALVHKLKRLMSVWVIEHIIEEDRKLSSHPRN
ncbi:MAG: bacteriohemerythrin [Thermodesulfobacteriota bacterium]